MPFINKSEATKRSKDRKIYGITQSVVTKAFVSSGQKRKATSKFVLNLNLDCKNMLQLDEFVTKLAMNEYL